MNAERPVPTAYSMEIAVRLRAVSAMMLSMNTEKTYDCPGPELNTTRLPTSTIVQP